MKLLILPHQLFNIKYYTEKYEVIYGMPIILLGTLIKEVNITQGIYEILL